MAVTVYKRMAAMAMAAIAVTVACAAAQPSAPPAFDGKLALEHVRKLVDIGPRVAGTPGAQKTRDYITAQMKALYSTGARNCASARA